MTHTHADATLTADSVADLALACPTCQARDLRAELVSIVDACQAAGLLVDAQQDAAWVQATVDQLDYVLALVDAAALDAGLEL